VKAALDAHKLTIDAAMQARLTDTKLWCTALCWWTRHNAEVVLHSAFCPVPFIQLSFSSQQT
jgi:hypothetical protein